MTTQSEGLSKRHKDMNNEGNHLNDDSKLSEKTLNESIHEIIDYAKKKFEPLGYSIIAENTISLYECQKYFQMVGGPEPNSENKKYYMKPDGGIIYALKDSKKIPILIVEDKVQGTNDKLYCQDKKRQSTGNAIERAAKNIRGAEMMFVGQDIFPYVLFAAGCDFHITETISKRIEMMNMGYPNHYINIDDKITPEKVQIDIEKIISEINISKRCGRSIASVFIKAHKWDKMNHYSSLWKKEERVYIMKNIIDKVFMSFS